MLPSPLHCLRTVGLLCLAAPLFAQSPGLARSYADDLAAMHTLVDVERNAAHHQDGAKTEAVQKRQLEFAQRLEEFTNTWNALVHNCDKGVWNPKQAKAVRKAFERLTRTEGWMEEK